MVAFPKEFEGADIVRDGKVFAVSLTPVEAEALPRPGAHLDRSRYLLAPSGCPVPRDAVGYMDFKLIESVDLGDFLLAVGECGAAALLAPERRNLTVNEIQQRGVPAGAVARLPFKGFDDAGEGIARAPVDGADMMAVYAWRAWGLFALTAGGRLSVTGWAAQCSHEPPRMWVGAQGEDAEAIRRTGRFALSLLAEEQLPVARDLARGVQPPAASLKDAGVGVPVLRDCIAHFACEVEGEFGDGGFYGPVTSLAWDRREAGQLRADQLGASG